jgi:hypothetical protein
MWGKLKLNSHQLNIKKKFDRNNFEKKYIGKHCSKTKTIWKNIITIHSVLKKNYEAKFSIILILKK